MTREEAINEIKSWIFLEGKEIEAIHTLIPELAESDDERIRKELIEAFDAYDIDSSWNGIPVKSVIAWLEKQKEQKPRDYRKLYEEVVNSEWFKQNYVGKSLGEEENPKEWSEEDEKKINFLSRLIEFQVKDDEYCFGDGRLISKQEAIEMLKSLRLSWKPSEEQMGALNYAYCELFKREDVGHNILGPLQKLCDELKKLMGACRVRTEPLQPTGRRWEATKPTHPLIDLDMITEDYVSFVYESFIAGAEWHKEQMLKEAVEADVNVYRDLAEGESWAEFVARMPTQNLGDKVRLVIIKEGEK